MGTYVYRDAVNVVFFKFHEVPDLIITKHHNNETIIALVEAGISSHYDHHLLHLMKKHQNVAKAMM